MEELPLRAGDSLLTSSEVDAWREEKGKLEGEIAKKQKRLMELEPLLAAAALFLRAKGGAPDEENVAPSSGGETLPDMIINILQEQHGPIPNIKIRELINKSEFGREKMKANPNYLYTVMGRLVSRQLVTKDERDCYEIRRD